MIAARRRPAGGRAVACEALPLPIQPPGRPWAPATSPHRLLAAWSCPAQGGPLPLLVGGK
jgi:hypothetical protein